MHSNRTRINQTVEIYIKFDDLSFENVQLTTEQRAFVVTNFMRTQSVREVQNTFEVRFPNWNPPM